MGNKRKITKNRKILNTVFVVLEVIAWLALGTACMLYLRANGKPDGVSVIPLFVGIALSILYAVRITNDVKLIIIEQNEDILQRLADIEARLAGKPVQKKNEIEEIEKELQAAEERLTKAKTEKKNPALIAKFKSIMKSPAKADETPAAETVAKEENAAKAEKSKASAKKETKTAEKAPAKKSTKAPAKTTEKAPAEKAPAAKKSTSTKAKSKEASTDSSKKTASKTTKSTKTTSSKKTK